MCYNKYGKKPGIPPNNQEYSRMDFQLVPCLIVIGIAPKHIRINVEHPSATQILGCLERLEWEGAALDFLQASAQAGTWTGVKFPEKVPEASDYAGMVAQGYLSELQIEGGWVYALTPLAVSQIYLVQVESIIRAQARGILQGNRTPSLGVRLRKFFTTAGARFAS